MPTYTSSINNNYQLLLDVSQISQNAAKTQSTLKLSLYVQSTGPRAFDAGVTGTVWDKKRQDSSWTVRKSFNHERKSVPNKTKRKIWEGTYTYDHAADKTLTIDFEVWLKTTTQGKVWSMPNLVVKGVYGGSGGTNGTAAAAARGIFVKRNTDWAPADAYVYSGGRWRNAEIYVRQSGVWKKVGG